MQGNCSLDIVQIRKKAVRSLGSKQLKRLREEENGQEEVLAKEKHGPKRSPSQGLAEIARINFSLHSLT